MKAVLFGVFVCFIALEWQDSVAEDHDWRYLGIYGSANWSTIYNICNAQTHYHQSPIDIIQRNVQYDPTLTPISLTASAAKDTMTLINNGHTVSFNPDTIAVRIQGGHMNGSFRIGGVHFHWASNDTGSEHRIDGKQFLMEMHFVTYDETRFSGVLNATGAVNSIAVLGVLFTLSSEDNPAFAQLFSYLKNVTIEEKSVKIPYFDLNTLLPSNTSAYFRYQGSLTTPPCAESVIWTVFKTTQTVSTKQMGELRKLQELIEPDNKTIDFLSNNWRPPQPLDGRIVSSSFMVAGGLTGTSKSTSVHSLFLATLFAVVAFGVSRVATII